ncbi:MAG: DNA-protecting protein DprA [Acidobacteria bacterium]|nr:DNA-protecting protein DprA [Acidobacteriota bacterium]
MELDAALPWLALTMTQGIAGRLSARLLRAFDSPEGVFRASLPSLESCNVPAAVAQAIFKKQGYKRAEKELATIRGIENLRLVNWTDPEYPQSLREIYEPPTLLYVRGHTDVLSHPSIGVVGTRKPTLYGTQMAERLGRELAARGLAVVSGMARGIDALSHQGAMAVNGHAIGVLGTGVDVFYPKENKKLYERVLQRGAIISEFPLGTHPAPENFPIRNRIVAGMPVGVVVVEGAQYSGSLITARLAMEYNRDVFAVPGNATQPLSFAPNQLIRQGAKLVTNGEDVISDLPTPIRAALVRAEAPEAEQRNLLAAASLTTPERKIYELLSTDQPVHIDDIMDRSGLNSSEVLATLFDLEMKGIVRQLPGKQFAKVLL